jgi:hypothetical protein
VPVDVSAGEWWKWCSPDVVDGVMAHFSLYSSGASEVQKLGAEDVYRCTTTNDFDAEDARIFGQGRRRKRHEAVQQALDPTVY